MISTTSKTTANFHTFFWDRVLRVSNLGQLKLDTIKTRTHCFLKRKNVLVFNYFHCHTNQMTPINSCSYATKKGEKTESFYFTRIYAYGISVRKTKGNRLPGRPQYSEKDITLGLKKIDSEVMEWFNCLRIQSSVEFLRTE